MHYQNQITTRYKQSRESITNKPPSLTTYGIAYFGSATFSFLSFFHKLQKWTGVKQKIHGEPVL